VVEATPGGTGAVSEKVRNWGHRGITRTGDVAVGAGWIAEAFTSGRNVRASESSALAAMSVRSSGGVSEASCMPMTTVLRVNSPSPSLSPMGQLSGLCGV